MPGPAGRNGYQNGYREKVGKDAAHQQRNGIQKLGSPYPDTYRV